MWALYRKIVMRNRQKAFPLHPAVAFLWLALLFGVILISFTQNGPIEKLFKETRKISSGSTPLTSLASGTIRSSGSTSFPEAGDKLYTVRNNDSWWKIADHFGIVDYKALQAYNDNRKLTPGMQVKIPLRMISK